MIVKHDQLQYWFKYRNSIRKDMTEDEALHYWTYLDTEDEPDVNTLDELSQQNGQKSYRLGLITNKTKYNNDKFVFYSARDHWLLPNNELPILISDWFELTFSCSNWRMFTIIDQQTETNIDTVVNYHLEFYDIDVYICYYELTDSQKQLFIDQRNVSGLTFLYRDLSCWQDVFIPSNGVMQETSFSAPTSILTNAVILFSNNDDSHYVYTDVSKNWYELTTTTSYAVAPTKQSKLMSMCSFCPNISQFYIKVDGLKFPHANGLQDVTVPELKKMTEHVVDYHLDIVPLWWFASTDFYLLTNFGHGNLYGWQDDPAIRGYVFEGSSWNCEIYLWTD